MSPYDPSTKISELLMTARIWIRHRADEHAGRQESLTRACVIAENDGIATPELSKSSDDLLCKKFKTQYQNCEQQVWYRRFKAQFEQYIMTEELLKFELKKSDANKPGSVMKHG